MRRVEPKHRDLNPRRLVYRRNGPPEMVISLNPLPDPLFFLERTRKVKRGIKAVVSLLMKLDLPR